MYEVQHLQTRSAARGSADQQRATAVSNLPKAIKTVEARFPQIGSESASCGPLGTRSGHIAVSAGVERDEFQI